MVEAAGADEARRLLPGDPGVSRLDVLPLGKIRPCEVWVGEPLLGRGA